MRITLGGAEVDLLSRDDVLDAVSGRLQGDSERPMFIASANLDHLYHFGIDSGREGWLEPGRGGADWLVLLDGSPLVRFARRRTGGVNWEQLAGSDLLTDLLMAAGRARARIGFIGGTEEMQRRLRAVLADHHPQVDLAGTWSPPRDVVDDPEASAVLAAEIRDAGVDLLVVGLGKPRQEEWLLRHGASTGARVAAAFGAATDFLAGTAERAPPRWRRAGLEWFHRLIHEPRRLARRYVIQGPSSLFRLFTRSDMGALAEAGRQARGAPVMTTPAAWRSRLGRVLVAGDVAIIGLASLLAYQLRALLGEVGLAVGFEREVVAAIAVLPFWVGLFHLLGCYRPVYLNAGSEAFRRFAEGAFAGLLGLGFVSFAFRLELARGYVGMLFLFVLLGGGALRLGVREYLRSRRRQGRFRQNVLVVGADFDGAQVARAMAQHEAAGYQVVGFLDDELPVGHDLDGIRVLGRPEEVLDLAYDRRAGLVVVSPSGVRPGTLKEITVALEGSPVDLAVAPSLFEVVTRRVTVESVANVPILHVDQIRLGRGKASAKRTLDLVGALGAGFVLLPLLVLTALAVLVREGRPVLFRQTRVGRDGSLFTLLKFRTMVPGAEGLVDDLVERNEAGDVLFKLREDPRVTPTGRFLRSWSIDELPQLWNVLRGDMSLVGPRPPLPSEVEKYDAWHMRRLRVRPGVTGVWQVSGRSDVPFEEAVRMDVFYIENWSLGFDLYMLARTVVAVLSRRGAW